MSGYDRVTYCEVVECCETCPRYGDDCDGDIDVDLKGGDAETKPIPTGTGVMQHSPNNGADSSAEAVQGWIPCSERLPLVGGEFLVTLVDQDGTWVSTAQWNMTFGGRWQDIFPNDGYRDISNVIAWKTLPKPYTKGDNDEER